MKKTILGLFLGMSVMGMATELANKSNLYESKDLTITANVIQLLKFSQTQPMDFGNIVLGEAANSIQDGILKVEGEKGYNVVVTVPATAKISKDGADETEVTLDAGGMNGKGQALLEGKLDITVSGSIKKDATKNTGMHTGTVTISARYE